MIRYREECIVMRRWRPWIIRFAAVVSALVILLPGSACMEGVRDIMAGMDIKLIVSYKKKGENNPLYTQRFGADPGVMEYDGRLYVFMTDDIIERDSAGNVKENSYSQIRCINYISSEDMVNWTDHGRIRVAGAGGIARGANNSWAPCAAHKTIDGQEKFFLYFCNGGNGIGVLTADSPTGPWRDELGKLLITRNTPNCANVTWLFDPAVMVDDDGTGYLAFGGGVPNGKQARPGTGRIVRLGEDMMSLDCDPVALDVPYLFEDSGINKINGKYIYSYCSNWQTDGNALRLSSGAIQYMMSVYLRGGTVPERRQVFRHVRQQPPFHRLPERGILPVLPQPAGGKGHEDQRELPQPAGGQNHGERGRDDEGRDRHDARHQPAEAL